MDAMKRCGFLKSDGEACFKLAERYFAADVLEDVRLEMLTVDSDYDQAVFWSGIAARKKDADDLCLSVIEQYLAIRTRIESLFINWIETKVIGSDRLSILAEIFSSQYSSHASQIWAAVCESVGKGEIALPVNGIKEWGKAGGYIVKSSLPSPWFNYGPGERNAAKDWAGYLRLLDFLKGKEFTHIACGGWANTETGRKMEGELKKRGLQVFAYISFRNHGWRNRKEAIPSVTHKGDIREDYACLSDPAYMEFKADLAKGIMRSGVSGLVMEEVFAGHICFCRRCQDKYRESMGSDMPYDPVSGEYIWTDEKVGRFKTVLLKELYSKIKNATGKPLAVFSVIGAWKEESKIVPATGRLGGNDYAGIGSDIVDMQFPEFYYCASETPSFLMYSLSKLGQETGNIYPWFDTYLENVTNPFELERGIFFALMGGAKGMGHYNHLLRNENWAIPIIKRLRPFRALYKAAYPGEVEVPTFSAGVLVNTADSASLYDAAGWVRTLGEQGFHVRPFTVEEITSLEGDRLFRDLSFIVLPAFTVLSREVCEKIEEAVIAGMGVVASYDTPFAGCGKAFSFIGEKKDTVLSKGMETAIPSDKPHPLLDCRIARRVRLADIHKSDPAEYNAAMLVDHEPAGEVPVYGVVNGGKVPWISFGTHGKGRYVYIAERMGSHLQGLYWSSMGRKNDLHFPIHGIYDVIVATCVARWVSAPAAAVSLAVETSCPDIEVYEIKKPDTGEKLAAIFNFRKDRKLKIRCARPVRDIVSGRRIDEKELYTLSMKADTSCVLRIGKPLSGQGGHEND